jgi:pimeloyl-ACP methyl ester carboxylesterase
LNIGQFEQVANSLRRSGCSNIEVFSFYKQGNDKRLAERIREVRTQNPNGQIVLVGYSMGALMVERALALLEPEGVVVDSAIYLDSYTLQRFGSISKPQNVSRNVLVYRLDSTVPEGLPRAETYRIDVRKHLDVPTSQQCYDILAYELLQQCSQGCPCACHHRSFEPVVEARSAAELAGKRLVPNELKNQQISRTNSLIP